MLRRYRGLEENARSLVWAVGLLCPIVRHRARGAGSGEPMNYEVIVGNVGSVYSGGSKREAYDTYDTYVTSSKQGVGRAGDEPVTLMVDGEIRLEHDPIEASIKDMAEDLHFEFDKAVDTLIFKKYQDLSNNERSELLEQCEKVFKTAAKEIAEKLVEPLKRRLGVDI